MSAGFDFDEDGDRFRWLRESWLGGIDERCYAAFRMAFSVVALINLINLWFYRDALFTVGGMVSADVVAAQGWQFYLSVFAWVDSSVAVSLIFVLAGVAMVCLGLGVCARAAAVLVFVWHVSFVYRILPAATGWDHVLSAYAFLVMISPLGKSLALVPRIVPVYGITLMRVQLLVIYWQGVGVKLSDKFWQDGEFLSYFLMSVHARWPHERVASLGDILIPVTYIALLIEIAIPVFLMIPRTRKFGFWLGFLFHLLIAVMGRHLFLFSLTMWMTYVAFVGVPVLERLERCLKRSS